MVYNMVFPGLTNQHVIVRTMLTVMVLNDGTILMDLFNGIFCVDHLCHVASMVGPM